MKEKTKKIIKTILLAVMILAFTAFVVGAVVTLATPTARIVGDTLYITPSAEAEGYRIYVDGTLYDTITSNIFSITSNITHGSLQNEGTLNIQSGASSTVTVVPDSTYWYPYSVSVSGATLASYNSSNGVVSLSNATGSVVVSGVCPKSSYPISVSVSHGQNDSDSDTTSEPTTTSEVLVYADTGYMLPTQVTVNGYTGASGTQGCTWTYTAPQNLVTGYGVIQITRPTQDISISVTCTAIPEYTIIGNITNGTFSDQYDSTIEVGANAVFAIVPNSNYTYPAQADITVTNATLIAYDSTTGVGTIANPTGNVTITATCPQSQPVGYVIPAGTYYGKASPVLSDAMQDISGDFTINNTNYSFIGLYTNVIMCEFRPETYCYTNGAWVNGYRTIVVNDDIIVDEYQYNAFFACFGGYTVTLTASGDWSNSSSGAIAIRNENDVMVYIQSPANKSSYPMTINLPYGTYSFYPIGGGLMGVYISSNDFTMIPVSYYIGCVVNKDGTIDIHIDDFDD